MMRSLNLIKVEPGAWIDCNHEVAQFETLSSICSPGHKVSPAGTEGLKLGSLLTA